MELLRERMESKDTARESMELAIGGDGQLQLRVGTDWVRVFVRPCFPWSHPEEFLSLAKGTGEEVAMIDSLDQLSRVSREALGLALKEARFCFKILDIDEVREDFEIRVWRVQTEQGPRAFQTLLDEWPRKTAGGGLLLKDVCGDSYYISSPHQLSETGRRLLWSFID